jgi:hypothetical protein
MKHVQKYESFLNENTGVVVDPNAEMTRDIVEIRAKINDLRAISQDKPEQANLILAKIQVENIKIQLINAQRIVIREKEKLDRLKEVAKDNKERDKRDQNKQAK